MRGGGAGMALRSVYARFLRLITRNAREVQAGCLLEVGKLSVGGGLGNSNDTSTAAGPEAEG